MMTTCCQMVANKQTASHQWLSKLCNNYVLKWGLWWTEWQILAKANGIKLKSTDMIDEFGSPLCLSSCDVTFPKKYHINCRRLEKIVMSKCGWGNAYGSDWRHILQVKMPCSTGGMWMLIVCLHSIQRSLNCSLHPTQEANPIGLGYYGHPVNMCFLKFHDLLMELEMSDIFL